MKKILLILVCSLFLVGCNDVVVEKTVVCNRPYIHVGSSCCLDQDNNRICDSDEAGEVPMKELQEACNLPSGLACIDFTASQSSIRIEMQNALGYGMEDIRVRLEGDVQAGCTGARYLGEDYKGTYVCEGFFPKGVAEADIIIDYVNKDTEEDRKRTGNLIVKIK